MDIIAQKTDFVTCSTNKGGDPAIATAFGVFKGIMAAVNFRLQRQDLEGLDILIQGAGNVGSLIAHNL
jgi:leucine dehydrogenase